jgi:ribonucleoside-diphosphate reductase alpha chain
MKIKRHYTKPNECPYSSIGFKKVKSEIRSLDGIKHSNEIEFSVPENWSQVACDILAQKYSRKTGISSKLKAIKETGVPSWLYRHEPNDSDLKGKKNIRSGETDARKIFDRMAGCWAYWGWKGGYFSTEQDALVFFDEIRYMLATQIAAPNSPQWFNTGLHWAYGITGSPQGHSFANHKTGQVEKSKDTYEHPQPHACFIQSVNDDLLGEDGVMSLWKKEARLFKYGSGTGTNFSNIRAKGEPLLGGGQSSGLMSFLKVGDVSAGAIKSGGTTRRAAKMVIVDIDHPDIEDFIHWKTEEEMKVAALVAGSKVLKTSLNAILN